MKLNEHDLIKVISGCEDFDNLIDELTYANYAWNRSEIEPEGYIKMGMNEDKVWAMERKFQHEYANEMLNRGRN